MNHLELITVYNESLYESRENTENIAYKTGFYARKVLVIVSSKDWNPDNELFLKKILQSCGLNDNDYLIVVSTESADIFEIINQNRPDILFMFGLKLESDFFNANKTLYKPFLFNGIKIVLAEQPDILQSDKEKRLMLWNQCIKPLFNIS